MRLSTEKPIGLFLGLLVMIFSSAFSNQALADCPPDPQATCSAFHPGSILTGGCGGPDCFSMAYAELVRAAAVDDQGLFPKKWHLWFPTDELVLGSYNSCTVTAKLGKLEVLIPAGRINCRFEMVRTSNGVVYHEHFVANPATSCLAWIECKSQ